MVGTTSLSATTASAAIIMGRVVSAEEALSCGNMPQPPGNL